MRFIDQIKAAWRRKQQKKISTGAWTLYSALFMVANNKFDLESEMRLTIAEMGKLIDMRNQDSIRRFRQELLDAQLIAEVEPGSTGKGNAGVYRLIDLCCEQQLKETLEGTKTELETLVARHEHELESENFSTAEMEPEKTVEPKPKRKRKAAAKPEPEPKKVYGDYGIVMLSDRQVGILEERYPGLWKQYLRRVESYCYNNKKQKRYSDYCQTIMNWIQRDQKKHPEWFQNQNQPEPKREISAAVVEAAKQIQSETPDIFAEARAKRQAAWQQ